MLQIFPSKYYRVRKPKGIIPKKKNDLNKTNWTLLSYWLCYQKVQQKFSHDLSKIDTRRKIKQGDI